MRPLSPNTKTEDLTEPTKNEAASAADPGLAAVAMLLRFYGVAANPDQIRHRYGTRIGVSEMLRCAKELGLRARRIRSKWDRLANTPLPGIALLRDGGFLLLGKAGDDKIMTQHPLQPRPVLLTRADFEAIWTGELVLMARRASLVDLAHRFDITWFLAAINKYRHLLGEVLVASFFMQLFGLVSPLLFQVVIDKVLVHRSLSTARGADRGACRDLALRIDPERAAHLPLRAHHQPHRRGTRGAPLSPPLGTAACLFPGAARRRFRGAGARARKHPQFLDQLRTDPRHRPVLHVRIPGGDVSLFPAADLVVIGGFPFYIGISAGATPSFRRRLDEKFRRGAENQALLVESITGVETLKAMAVEPQIQRKWEEQLASYVSASFRVLSLGNVASNAVQLVSKLVSAAILFIGAQLVIDGTLTVGELVAFNIMAGRVSAPVLRLAAIWQDFHQARLSILRLGDILNTPAEPTYSPARSALPTIRGDTTFEHVTFRYRIDGPEVLHDVNFTVPAGQVVGIVGASGSGKSTLAKLIQRLFVPESGRVLIDGVDLAMVDPAWLRRQVGFVLQENVLFNCSVRENIALSDPGMPIERVLTAAKLAGAHDFVLELPEGYDTVVGERGSSLSGGQKQRLAIARALITDPRILIFDEATSALDYESERIIQQGMKEIARGRTVLVIAHRLSTVRRSDRIIAIDRGRLVEDGTHDQLIATGGRYATLHRIQAGIQEVG